MPHVQPRASNGSYLCAMVGCTLPCYAEYIFCGPHFDAQVNRGVYVPTIQQAMARLEPYNEPFPGGIRNQWMCLANGCGRITHESYAYCVEHFRLIADNGGPVPVLGEPACTLPITIKYYRWFAHAVNRGGATTHRLLVDDPELEEVLRYSAAGSRNSVLIVRGLLKEVYSKVDGRIRGPNLRNEARLNGVTLPKEFTDGEKVPKRFHREFRRVIASGIVPAQLSTEAPHSPPQGQSIEELLEYRPPVSYREASVTGAIRVGEPVYNIPRPDPNRWTWATATPQDSALRAAAEAERMAEREIAARRQMSEYLTHNSWDGMVQNRSTVNTAADPQQPVVSVSTQTYAAYLDALSNIGQRRNNE